MKFTKGKWYKNSEWENEKDFLKCNQSTNNEKVYFFENIKEGKYCKYTYLNSWWYNFADKIVEALYEEYSPYLPEGHPDLITKDKVYEIF